jgi:hypothetical protein
MNGRAPTVFQKKIVVTLSRFCGGGGHELLEPLEMDALWNHLFINTLAVIRSNGYVLTVLISGSSIDFYLN